MQTTYQTKPAQNTHINEPRDSRSHREFAGFRDNRAASRRKTAAISHVDSLYLRVRRCGSLAACVQYCTQQVPKADFRKNCVSMWKMTKVLDGNSVTYLYPSVDCVGKKSDEAPGTIGIHGLSKRMS